MTWFLVYKSLAESEKARFRRNHFALGAQQLGRFKLPDVPKK